MNNVEFLAILLAQLAIYHSLITKFIDESSKNVKDFISNIAIRQRTINDMPLTLLTADNNSQIKNLNTEFDKVKKRWKFIFNLPLVIIVGEVILSTIVLSIFQFFEGLSNFLSEHSYIQTTILLSNLLVLTFVVVSLKKLKNKFETLLEKYVKIENYLLAILPVSKMLQT